MLYNNHYNLKGKHSILSPSQPHWIRYNEEKLKQFFKNKQAAARGTKYHEVAEQLILLGERLPDTNRTFNAYVNDCIRFQMQPEVLLFYSQHCFGTVDSISYKNNILKIFDLKTGVGKVKDEQLETYCALFCLEYGINPNDIEDIICRIYQNDEYREWHPNRDDIIFIMTRIKDSCSELDKLYEEMRL